MLTLYVDSDRTAIVPRYINNYFKKKKKKRLLALGGQCHVVNVDRDNDTDIISCKEIDRVVRDQASESQLQKCLMQLLVPLASC